MKPPRSDKSFIDRLEGHIDTQHLNIPSPEKISTPSPPPPPHEPSQTFLSPDPGKSLHPSPENIATPPKHFKQSKKNRSPLTQTQPLKGNVIRPYNTPPPKKKKPTSQPLEKNRTSYLGKKCHLLSNN